MGNEKIHFCAPVLDRFRFTFGSERRNGGQPEPYSAETMKALDELFADIRHISPYYDNGVRKLFFQIERGRIEDYEDYEEMLADGTVKNRGEFEEMWKRDYPDESQWFAFSFYEDDENGYRGIWLDSLLIMETMPNVPAPPHPMDFSEFAWWLVGKVRECLPDIKSGEYNRKIRRSLSPEMRIGTVLRNAYWQVYPEEKTEYLSELPDADQKEFLELMETYKEDTLPTNMITDMTSGLFFRCCAMGYKANHYDGCDTLSPKELYLKHADGRDEGLTSIDENSPEEFRNWYAHRQRIGHPWEVCRGGNSTHVSLYVSKADAGFYFVASGSSRGRSIETIKFYLALHHAGMPVVIDEGNLLADRIRGDDKIGIVPKGVTPCYCSSYFPGEEILDFMNLPFEKRAALAAKCVWRDEPEITILQNK